MMRIVGLRVGQSQSQSACKQFQPTSTSWDENFIAHSYLNKHEKLFLPSQVGFHTLFCVLLLVVDQHTFFIGDYWLEKCLIGRQQVWHTMGWKLSSSSIRSPFSLIDLFLTMFFFLSLVTFIVLFFSQIEANSMTTSNFSIIKGSKARNCCR